MMLEIGTHRNILVHLLKDIYTDPELAPVLGFKGGTAAYLFYNLGRFSVDLDFDLLDAEKEEIVFKKLQTILHTYGDVKEARKKRYSLFFLLSYKNKTLTAYNIKIEVNRRNFGSRYEVKSYLGIPVKVMVPADMAAHKMVAMIERKGLTNRDIFDVWFFLKNQWPINEEIIKKRTGFSMAEFVRTCIDMLEKKSDRGILSGVGELLDAPQKAWAKTNLRQETIFLLKMLQDSIARAQ